jgi:hypothetical protein
MPPSRFIKLSYFAAGLLALRGNPTQNASAENRQKMLDLLISPPCEMGQMAIIPMRRTNANYDESKPTRIPRCRTLW